MLAELSRSLQQMSQAIADAIKKMQQTVTNFAERLDQNAVHRDYQPVQDP
jgi:predicted DNA-binding protein YlxM (UPF0122 family)